MPHVDPADLADRLAAHPLFQAWDDPVSGQRSWMLTGSGATQRQVWYFVSPCIDLAADRLWYHASYPPAAGKHLGVVSLDPDNAWLREFPAAGIESADPWLEPGGRSALTGMADGVYRCTDDGDLSLVARLDDALLLTGGPGVGAKPGRYTLQRLASHLTVRPNGTIPLDCVIGTTSVLVELDPAAGTSRVLHRFDREAGGHGHYDHAQASPVDSDLTLIAQDWDRDLASGTTTPFRERLWIHDRADGSLTYLTPGQVSAFPRAMAHEWWTADGHVAWCHYTDGVFRCDPRRPGEIEHVWQRSACHAHCDAAGEWWVCDDSPYRWASEPCQVIAYHRPSGREVVVASGLPEPTVNRARWHVDPHPQLTSDGSAVVYTTTARGAAELAVCPLPAT